MNRRGFLGSLAAVAVVPFVPKPKAEHWIDQAITNTDRQHYAAMYAVQDQAIPGSWITYTADNTSPMPPPCFVGNTLIYAEPQRALYDLRLSDGTRVPRQFTMT